MEKANQKRLSWLKHLEGNDDRIAVHIYKKVTKIIPLPLHAVILEDPNADFSLGSD
ncbi:hypothetical protein SK128_004220 [Halocaridina rubra]|uniref:Uncharacterized protein n=1 Tax=Halocaridina rubra TaxID=373956 RepID=A0AAN9AGG8_HALRR